MNQKNHNGFSLIEVLVVMLTVMLMFYFVYNFLSQTQRVVSDKNKEVTLVEQQVELYEALINDFSNSFMSRDAADFLQEISLYQSGGFKFYVEHGGADLKGVAQEGIYEVSYRLLDGAIERHVKLPSGTWGDGTGTWLAFEDLPPTFKRN